MNPRPICSSIQHLYVPQLNTYMLYNKSNTIIYSMVNSTLLLLLLFQLIEVYENRFNLLLLQSLYLFYFYYSVYSLYESIGRKGEGERL